MTYFQSVILRVKKVYAENVIKRIVKDIMSYPTVETVATAAKAGFANVAANLFASLN